MPEAPISNPEFYISSRYLDPDYQADRTHPVWQNLRLNPPHLIAIISDSVQYLVDDQPQIVGFEVSDGARDRIDSAIAIHQEFPDNKFLTLSTSFDNLIEYFPESTLYQLSIIMTGRVPVDSFLLPDSRTYDTFTELIKIADTSLWPYWGQFDNIAIVAGRKQAGRIAVMLDTIRCVDDPGERARFDRYFEVYMPKRLTRTPEARVHSAFAYFKNIAYSDLLPNVDRLRSKNFLVVCSEDVMGTTLVDHEDYESNLRGVQDWLDGTYGQEYLQPSSGPDTIKLVTRRSSAPIDTPRLHIPHTGTAEAKEKGIGWGVGYDTL